MPGLWEIQHLPEGAYTVMAEKDDHYFQQVIRGVAAGTPPIVIVVDETHQAGNQSILFWAIEHVPPDFHCDNDVEFDDLDVMAAVWPGRTSRRRRALRPTDSPLPIWTAMGMWTCRTGACLSRPLPQAETVSEPDIREDAVGPRAANRPVTNVSTHAI